MGSQTTSLGNAYGVCVILVTFITTCMVSLVAILIWRLPSWVVLPIFLVFAALDGVYLTSVLTKVPEGAWFTLLLASVLSTVFILWRFGKEAQWAAESEDRVTASALLTSSTTSLVLDAGSSTGKKPSAATNTTLRLRDAWGGTPISTVPGLGIFFDKTGDASLLPVAFAQFLRKFSARPRVLVFFHMRPLPVPSVPLAERYVVTRVGGGVGPRLENCYVVVLRHGYVDDVVRPGMGRELVKKIEAAIVRSSGSGAVEVGGVGAGGGSGLLVNERELETLRLACEEQTVYVLGKEALRIREAGPLRGKDGGDGRKGVGFGKRIRGMPRRMVLALFLWIRENSRTKLADLDIDVDKLVEVGFVKEI